MLFTFLSNKDFEPNAENDVLNVKNAVFWLFL